jgi:nucleosome binding factor SPN SPT16 subunit
VNPPGAESLAALERLAGVEKLSVKNRDVSFTLHGDVNEAMHIITQQPMESLDVERPSLEEIFLTFYGSSANGGEA